MNAIGEWVAIATIAGAAAAGTYLVKGPPARVFRCDPADLKPGEVCLEHLPSGAPILWVDARARKDWERNGIPGSILWNLDANEDMQAFEAEAVTRIVETPHVVVYCSTEACGVSHQVAEQIRKLGLATEVQVLRGGWQALRDAGKVKPG